MNNKVTINAYLSTIETKTETKQMNNRDRIMDMESVLMVAQLEGGAEEWLKR